MQQTRRTSARYLIALVVILSVISVQTSEFVGQQSEVMTVTIEAGDTLADSVTQATIETGWIEFPDQTILRVIATQKWRVRATAVVVSFPGGATNPTANAIQIKNSLGIYSPAGPPGVIVQRGFPTPAQGITFGVDLRVMLKPFEDGKAGLYQFTINYTIEEDI